MLSNSGPLRATNSANLSMIFRSPVSAWTKVKGNSFNIPKFRWNTAAAIFLTFHGRTIYIDISLPKAKLLSFDANSYEPFGAAGVSIFFFKYNSNWTHKQSAIFKVGFALTISLMWSNLRIRFRIFFLMIEIYEENNVTPYFYNNFRSHCQFRILTLALRPARSPLTFHPTVKCVRVKNIICQTFVIIVRIVEVFGNVNWLIQTTICCLLNKCNRHALSICVWIRI